MKRRSAIGRAFSYELSVFVVFVALVGLTVWCKVAGCEGDRDEAKNIVEGAGYTKIEIGGARSWRCGRDDDQSNEFTAIGPNGRYVEGTVCCSFLGCGKGCTIRIEP